MRERPKKRIGRPLGGHRRAANLRLPTCPRHPQASSAGRWLGGRREKLCPLGGHSKIALVLLSQKVAADGEQNHLFGRIHTSAMGRLVWVCRDQTMMKRGFRPMWRGSRA